MSADHQRASARAFSVDTVPCPVRLRVSVDTSSLLLPLIPLHESRGAQHVSSNSPYLYPIESHWPRHVLGDVFRRVLHIDSILRQEVEPGSNAAVVGGLSSLMGSVLGGFILGYVISFVNVYSAPENVFLAILAFLLLALFLRPQGILGSKEVRRV